MDNKKFNHRDFIFAKDAKILVYNDVLRVLKECIHNSDCILTREEREIKDIKFGSSSVQSNNKFELNCSNSRFSSRLKCIFSC